MKKMFLLTATMLFTVCLFSQKQTESGAQIKWEERTHDFGDVVQGDKVEFIYKFTNTGNEPLIITNVQPSCGCTLPKSWPRNEIMPGQSGELVIAFNSAGKPFGKLTRTTGIVSNAVNSEAGQIIFTANIVEKKAAVQ